MTAQRTLLDYKFIAVTLMEACYEKGKRYGALVSDAREQISKLPRKTTFVRVRSISRPEEYFATSLEYLEKGETAKALEKLKELKQSLDEILV